MNIKLSKLVVCAICLSVLGLSTLVNAAELKMGIIPLEAPKVMYTQFTPLAEYLSKELGVEVKLVIGKDYQTIMDALGKNEVQFAYLTPTTYPKCEKQNPDAGIKPLVRFLVEGKGSYHSCIIIPSDSPISDVSQLKGKSFAFGSEDSTSSHLMPRAMMAAAGINIDKDLTEYKYLGSHTNAATAVKMKTFDAAGVKESVAEKFSQSGDAKILKTSQDIPEFPICINGKMDEAMIKKLQAAFLKLKTDNEDHKAVLTSINKKYTGCETTQSENYDVIRDMIKNLYGDDFYKRD